MSALFTAKAFIRLTDAAQSDVSRVRHQRRRDSRRGPKMRRITAVVICGVSGLMLLAGTAHGKGSVYQPAPSFPNSTLAIKVVGKPQAGKIVRLQISGSNAPFEIGYPGSGEYLSYSLDAFAQNGKVLPECPRAFGEELQNQANLGINRIAQGLNEGFYGSFNIPIRFQTSRRIRNIVVCAYSRLVTDDAVVSAIGFKLRPPRCTCRRH
jgi:hypothetical protein